MHVQMFLRLKGIKIPSRNIFNSPKIKAELIKGGGKKQVPCLRIETETGQVKWLYESSDIINYFRQNQRNVYS